ncbi:bifunctional 5-dehydro-2-deoxygluconokinase/5-dehydro-2-deoxyphosphogluconate aldolase [Vogesella indigofera]|uniref:bifunctional 5-dehydro-2-deoxygluconokinase/5-dehydro-2- deoxyphosphogluconate aldolase n=1 Tax=Vogesella indigofera TaxID=45465 RepID=UPI00234F4CF3|nr:5-dehydro-2-deoxygluconokinase [Vogesella indigofera]MDC7699678.1 5-dehydro-2-deoxygluconokinase [Vogesella indigofera]
MQNQTSFAPDRNLDVICLGRLAVDLYARQLGARLEDASSFAKYLGGSSANIAFGTARLGLKSAMLSRVGDEQMGRFLLETLEKEGCDISQVKTDPQRLTGVVLLGIKDRDTFPLLFYRENCADMALCEDDIDEAFIASSKSLLITGTHLSTEKVNAASRKALGFARKHNVRTVLDIDYRPVLWGLTGRGDGEQRFIADDAVSTHLQSVLPLFDLIVGTEEEFLIAGGKPALLDCLQVVRQLAPQAVLVVKRGPLGCAVIDGDIPADIDDAFTISGAQVEVMNVLGAGDAFLSGFLSAWLRGEDYASCCRRANACGALVVSRHGCSAAMPTPAELDYFLGLAVTPLRPAEDPTLARLHRVSVKRKQWDNLCVFAFDHRNQFFELARQNGVPESRISQLKTLLVQAVAQTEAASGLQGRTGILVDDRYGEDAMYAATGRGWWIGRPIELPGSNPLEFDHGRALAARLEIWPQEHIIKCLVQYHPDDEVGNRLEQEAQVRAVYQMAQLSGHELLLEVIPSRKLPQQPDTVLRALKRFYNLGIYPEWWKLESMSAEQWQDIDNLLEQRDPYCRGVVLLGLNAPVGELRKGFEQARDSRSCRGFMVGRTLFQEPSQRWLAGEIDDAGLIAAARHNFETLIDIWQAQRRQAQK